MITHLNSDTYRVQFIKEVENRRGGRSTIKTICKIFKYRKFAEQSWELFSMGVARQNPKDKYNHLTGKRLALRNAMIKEVIRHVNEDELMNPPMSSVFYTTNPWNDSISIYENETIYHFDRVDRCIFAESLEAEFGGE